MGKERAPFQLLVLVNLLLGRPLTTNDRPSSAMHHRGYVNHVTFVDAQAATLCSLADRKPGRH
jgi:hypothetical protein